MLLAWHLYKRQLLTQALQLQRKPLGELHRNFLRLAGPLRPIDRNRGPINCFKSAIGDYAVAPLDVDLSIETPSSKHLEQILINILQKVHLQGRSIAAEDCEIVNVMLAGGAYFPSLHCDIEHDMFDNDAFQVWILLRPHPVPKRGNMFLVHSDLAYERGYGIGWNNGQIRTTPNVHEFNPNAPSIPLDIHGRVTYVDIEPKKEALVFNGNLAHMSDFRCPRTPRVALNFRVLVKRNGTIQCNLNRFSTYIHKKYKLWIILNFLMLKKWELTGKQRHALSLLSW